MHSIYPEYVIMIILLTLILLALGAVIFLLVKIYNENGSGFSSTNNNFAQTNDQSYFGGQMNVGGGMNPYANQKVYCQKCSMEYDASQWCCPRCGTPRQ